MGFGEQKENGKLKPLLVLCLREVDLKELPQDKIGADAVIIGSAGIKKGELKAFIKSSTGATWGGWLKEAGSGEVKEAEEAGFDFIAFNENSASGSVLENSNLGRIIELDTSLDEGLFKTIGSLPVDAVLISGDYINERRFNWHNLMLLKRFAGMLPQPIVVTIPDSLSDSELKALWDMGVDGFALQLKEGKSLEILNQVIKQVDAIKWPRRHDKSKKGALLPGVGFSKETDE